MTNLIEKSLLTGFGIFILIIFLSLIMPFYGRIAEFNKNERTNLEKYVSFVNKIDYAIEYIIENPESNYLEKIDYPNNLKIFFNESYIKFEIIIEEKTHFKFLEYEGYLFRNHYYELSPQTYLVNVSRDLNIIKVNFIS